MCIAQLKLDLLQQDIRGDAGLGGIRIDGMIHIQRIILSEVMKPPGCDISFEPDGGTELHPSTCLKLKAEPACCLNIPVEKL